METHTLARYISESTLQESQFIDVKPSLVAAAAMYLALRMRKLGGWVSAVHLRDRVMANKNGPGVLPLPSLIPRLIRK